MSRIDELDIIDLLQQFGYVPRRIIEKLLCKNQKDLAYLNRELKRLVYEKTIIAHETDTGKAYSVPLFNGQTHNDRIKALWILTQFKDVDQYFSGKDFIQIVFISHNTLYEIITLNPSTYRIVVQAVNQNTEPKNMPKRIVIVNSEEEANMISNDILSELNCIALCTVDMDGNIESFDFGDSDL